MSNKLEYENNERFWHTIENVKKIFPIRRIIFYDDMLHHSINPTANSVLDIGGGEGNLMNIFKRKLVKPYRVSAEGFSSYIKSSKKKKHYEDAVQCDIRHLPFKEKTFDIVTCFHVIEHLEKEDGVKLIENMERIARKQVIIVTPVGFQELHVYDNNPHQTHKSGWIPKEFEDRGYVVKGNTGLRYLRGERAGSISNNRLIKTANFIATCTTQLITYFKPNLAWAMLCVKDMEKNK